MLRPRSNEKQWIGREEYKISPITPAHEYKDVYGNLCQRLIAQPGTFSIRTSAEVRVEEFFDEKKKKDFVEVQNLPDSVLGYLLPSRYCESDRFSDMAFSITAGQALGYDQVAKIEDWLRQNIQYLPGTSNVAISAVEVNLKQSGVCRDFAHLGIALCRGLSIPARMVVGYLHELKPMDLHAWFEAYVGDKWYTFDAVHSGVKRGYVAVGYGRDAADVAIFNQFGPAAIPVSQQVSVELFEPVT